MRAAACVAVLALLLSVSAAERPPRSAADVSKGTDLILSAVYKRDTKAIGELIGVQEHDPNQPSKKGLMPIIEAVKGGDFATVDMLIHYGAYANVKEPKTGVTPLHIAHERGNAKLARLLMKFGADPNVKDNRGNAPRDVVPNIEIRDLLALYDDQGHEAFEDAPGDWIRSKDDSGHMYFFNVKTEEARWTPPPSCAWKVLKVEGHPLDYINELTGQQMHRTPKALAWRKVKKAAEPRHFWFNFKTNHSQHTEPGELSADLIQELEQSMNLRWYNPKTDEISWEDPIRHNPWRHMTDDKTGDKYWYNVLSGESTWEVPEHLAWEKHHDDKQNHSYYFNTKTGASEWEAPNHLAWEAHSNEL